MARSNLAAGAVLLLCPLLGAPGCLTSPPDHAELTIDEPDAGLETITGPSDSTGPSLPDQLDDLLASAREDFAEFAARDEPEPPVPERTDAGPEARDEVVTDEDPPAAKPAEPAPPNELALADRLAWLLRERAALSDDPSQAVITLALLESIQPGLLDDLDRGEGLGQMLAPSEVESIQALRRIALGATGDPGALADVLDREAQALAASSGVRISDAALCSRVTGFGRYVTLASDSFVRGRPPRMILYTEIDRFAHRAHDTADGGMSGDRWSVELTQELSLFVDGVDHDATWKQPAQRVVETSRRRIRDLFLVQELVLPANLSLGSYSLRVRITDVTNGSSDERVIPLRIVAQPVAIR